MKNSQSKILIIVQARSASSRLPNKVMLPILGKTLLFRMIERLSFLRNKVEIVIATSTEKADDQIENEAKKYGINCFRGNLYNLLDRHYQAAKHYKADIAVKIPSDCPLIDPRIVDDLLDYYFENDGEADYVSNLHPATFPDGNDVEIMTMQCLEKVWKEAKRPLELEHTTPYIWESPEKFCLKNFSNKSGIDYSMSHRFTIDYLEDYHFIKQVYEALYPVKNDFSCDDILNLLKQKPEIFAINEKWVGVNWYRNHLDELKTVSIEQTKLVLN